MRESVEKGDKVRLIRDSEFYYQARELIGTVENMADKPGWVEVTWSNGDSNYYRHILGVDLELARPLTFQERYSNV